MIDHEVEKTLREIRERVLADAPQTHAGEARDAADGSNGLAHAEGSDAAPLAPPNGPGAGVAGDALARLQANLSTTERAWSRLPPVMSYRSGWVARLELWLKRLVKRAAHWFTWEQVNFNSAVHHALGDARDALAALAHAQSDAASLRASVEAERARSAELRARLSAAESRAAAAEARVESGLAELSRAIGAAVEQLRAEQQAHAGALRAEQNAVADGLRAEQRALTQGLRDEQQARAKELLEEMRGRADRLLEEQRVCFRQLSLEAGESAVMQDRARRQIEGRIDALERQNRER